MSASRLYGRRMRASLGCLVVLTLLAGATAGCGGKKAKKNATVEGKVNYKNKPVTGGTIRFFSTEGGKASNTPAAQGNINGDGTFNLGVPMGDYRVAIETESVKSLGGAVSGMRPPPGVKVDMPKPPEGGMVNMQKYMWIPPQYADPNQSGLTWNVNEKENKKDFDLK